MKTHYRKVFKSDHLGIADLEDLIEEGRKLIFTINKVEQYVIYPNDRNSGVTVAGKRISANIAYFVEGIKPLVLNATNSKVVKSFNNSAFVEDWGNTLVELYIDSNVRMKGETVGGVRIRQAQPKLTLPELLPGMAAFEKVKEVLKKGNYTMDQIKTKYTISKSIEKELLS